MLYTPGAEDRYTPPQQRPSLTLHLTYTRALFKGLSSARLTPPTPPPTPVFPLFPTFFAALHHSRLYSPSLPLLLLIPHPRTKLGPQHVISNFPPTLASLHPPQILSPSSLFPLHRLISYLNALAPFSFSFYSFGSLHLLQPSLILSFSCHSFALYVHTPPFFPFSTPITHFPSSLNNLISSFLVSVNHCQSTLYIALLLHVASPLHRLCPSLLLHVLSIFHSTTPDLSAHYFYLLHSLT